MLQIILRRAATAAALAAAGGIAAAGLGLMSPAHAAGAVPTISAPASTSGYHTIAITGTATAGATVELLESAYVFHDLQPALNWADGTNDPIVTTAAADGTYRLTRWMDTGFLFAVRVDGVQSRTITVRDKLVPLLTVTSTKAGTVTARMVATPAQPWVPVQIQRKNANGSWSVVARGYTADPGTFGVTLTRQPARRTMVYRAYLGGDPESALLPAYSTAHSVKVR